MLVYENRQDIIDNVRNHVERQLELANATVKLSSPRSHESLVAKGKVSALLGVKFYLENYTFRNEEAEVSQA